MANTLAQNQIYTIINAINAQAKTGGALTAVDTSSFTAVAQTLLLSGYDNLISAISQVLSQTIFSHRPYTAILDILNADAQRYGNHVRKIVPLDWDAEADDRLPLTDGQSSSTSTGRRCTSARFPSPRISWTWHSALRRSLPDSSL